MVKSMFAGIAGLKVHQSKMDVIGNNIANVNTFGYKSSRAVFQESIYQTINGSSAGGDTFGGSNPSQLGYGAKISSIDLMFTTGAYCPTENSTDCMVDGNGFFLVGPKIDGGVPNYTPGAGGAPGTPGGLGQLQLTRVGNFKLDGDGYLVDANQNVVYGFFYENPQSGAGGALVGEEKADLNTAVLRPIRLQQKDGTAGAEGGPTDRLELNNLKIDATGNLIGTNGTTKEIMTVAKVAVANVPNPNALEKAAGPYYKAVKNTGAVQAHVAGTGATGLIMGNGLEMSNVDLAKEFSELITTQRGFQANTKIMTVTDEMLAELVNLKR